MNNLAGTLRKSAAKHPDLVAVNFLGQNTTYRELETSANKIANTCGKWGSGKETGLPFTASTPRFLWPGFMEFSSWGRPVVTVSLLLHHSEVEYVLKDSGAQGGYFS